MEDTNYQLQMLGQQHHHQIDVAITHLKLVAPAILKVKPTMLKPFSHETDL